jgi:hypothetical protein
MSGRRHWRQIPQCSKTVHSIDSLTERAMRCVRGAVMQSSFNGLRVEKKGHEATGKEDMTPRSQMVLDQWSCVQDVRSHGIGQLQRHLAPIRISQRNRDDLRGKLRTHQIKTRPRPCIDVGAWNGADLGANYDCVVLLRLVDCSRSLLPGFAASTCCQSFASALVPHTVPYSSRFRSLPVPARCGIQVLLTPSTRS